ncbi:lantibiotic dehydratase C-terminal domain-containing protein [Arthrobacter yangruifuii]|uniref:lantibiotic dehydratase C-terminal domain-containing protein n=1 Tax=Arthrobacter yangruifuii TaxID=2606616 RepID=UPI0016486DD3|nr:lantibiotic dehydratase C-terminal domain-containing protein [Arthrobacter yangruifuii]
MTQQAALRIPSRTSPNLAWWNLTVDAGGFELADRIIGELVTPLIAQARLWGAQRWFYTRRMQPSNAQVRLRVLAPPETLDRLKSLLGALQEQSGDPVRSLAVEHGLSEPVVDRTVGTDALPPTVEADVARYGGVDGLALAEEVFELSSDLCLWATARFAKAQNRSALASLLLFDSAYAMMKGPRASTWPDRRRVSWEYYWDSHLHSCTASDPRAAGVQKATGAQAQAQLMPVHRLMMATASESAVTNWRRRWLRTIDTYLYRADKAGASRSAQHLTVYQAHGLLNRLGFTLRQEALIGVYARTWSREKEAELAETT